MEKRKHSGVNRRRVLQAIGAAFTLPGCCLTPIDRIGDNECAAPIRTLMDEVPPPSVPIAIDVHNHIFNALDMDAAGYLREPIANDLESPMSEIVKAIADPLVNVACAIAPTAAQEHRRLCEEFSRPGVQTSALTAMKAESQSRRLAKEAEFATRLARELAGTDFKARYQRLIRPGSERDHGFRGYQDPGASDFSAEEILEILKRSRGPIPMRRQTLAAGSDPSGAFRLGLRFVSLRLDNLLEAMEAYATPREAPAVAVFMPTLVEFNHWFGKQESGALLEDQITLMEMLNVGTGGRVLPRVGFNPWTDVRSDGRHLDIVKDAVMRRGFVGVKIYPTIGFRPDGNAESLFCKPLPEVDPEALNRSMEALFRWSRKEMVPIMAHTGATKALCDVARENTSPDVWQSVVSKHPGVPLHFAHFAGDNRANDRPKDGEPDHPWARKYVELMQTPGANHVYADVGYWESLFDDHTLAEKFLRQILATPSGASRLMYGSDHHMLVVEPEWARYPDAVAKLLHGTAIGREGESRREALFFDNAVRHYGLNKGGANRGRLEAFFARHRKRHGDGVRLSKWFERADHVA